MTQSLIPILDLILTTHDRDDFHQNLGHFMSLLFETRHTLASRLDQCFSQQHQQVLLPLFSGHNGAETDALVIKEHCQHLSQELGELPILRLQVAIKVPHKLLTKISQWIRRQTHSLVILDITTNPEMMGGVILYVDGRYKDYSLSKRLTDLADRGELKLSQLFT